MKNITYSSYSPYIPMYHQNHEIDAAVLLGVSKNQNEESILLTRRSAHLRKHAGEVSFPGGQVEAKDVTVADTAIREANEEVGLLPHHLDCLGYIKARRSLAGLLVQPVVVQISDLANPRVANKNEVESVFRVPAKHFLSNENIISRRFNAKGQKYEIDAYQFGEYTIWGLTAFWIIDYLNHLYEEEIPLPIPKLIQ